MSRREVAAAAGLLLLLVVVAYCNVVFGGRSLVYSDSYNPLDLRVDENTQGPGHVPLSVWRERGLWSHANFHDPGAAWWQWEPGGEFLLSALRQGEWPWWDPYVGAGAPAMGNLTQAFFFPPYFAVVALGNGVALKNAYFLLVLLAAALASYLFLRRHDLSREASIAGAVAVLFCGALNKNVGSFIGHTGACLPIALLSTRWFLDVPGWRRAAGLAVAYAAISLASFPPLVVATFGISAVYAAVDILTSERRGRAATLYLTAVAVALGLVAWYYLPAQAVMREAPSITAIYRGAAVTVLPWPQLAQLLTPTLLGGGQVFHDPPMRDIGTITVPWLGVAALLLASLAGPVPVRRARLLFWAIAGLAAFIVLKLTGVEPVQSVRHLPLLRNVHWAHHFGIPLGLLLALAAGIGVHRLLAGRISRARGLVGIVPLAIVVLALPAIAMRRGVFAHAMAATWLRQWYVALGWLLAGATLVLALAGVREGGARRRWWGAAAIVALLAAEGVFNVYYPRPRRWDVWKHPVPYVRVLKARSHFGRVYGAGAFHANAGSVHEIFQLDSMMTFNAERMLRLYARYVAPGRFLGEATLLPPERVLDAASVSLLAIRSLDHAALGVEAAARGHREIFADEYLRIFERRSAPRYHFTSLYRVVGEQEALESLAGPGPPGEVLVEVPLPFPPEPNDGREPPVVVQRFGRNEVRLRVRAPRAGLLYCSESFFPGWQATVDGRTASIVAANYAFRAVPVPAGDVVVELRYRPPGLSAGLGLSAAASLGLVAMSALGSRRRGG